MASAATSRAAPARTSRLRAAFDWEPPELAPGRAGVVLLVLVLFGFSAVATGITLFGNTLTETLSWTSVGAFFRSGELPEGTPWIRQHFAALYLPLLLGAVAVRFGVTFFGTLRYEQACGEPLPLHYLIVMMLTNVLFFVLPLALVGVLGFGATLFGHGFADGGSIFREAVAAVNGAIARWVPTLFTVPYPWPLVFAMIPAGLGYYWWHRLQHVWRPLWLLSHRPHHTMLHLAQPAALPADSPLAFLLNTIPQALLIGTASKLFASEPMLLESMLWIVLSWTFTEVFNHTEAVYRWTLGGPLRRAWFHFFGCGAWHQVHHSSAEEHRLANLGGGPFMLWDRVFGTFHEPPERKPAMGLTGRPPVRFTPLRLALAGHVELVQELLLNRSWKQRLLILLGPASYRPPVAVSHLVGED